MKIKILKSNNKTTWYCNMINQVIDVKYDMKYQRRCFTGNDGVHCLFNDDYVITELPESFCVKRGDDEEKWKKYIQWLNKTCKNDFNGNGVNPYYGLHKGSGWYSHVSFGTEIHIDDMIKHIDFYSEPMVLESEEEFDLTTDEGRLAYAKKHYPIGTEYIPLTGQGTDFSVPLTIDFKPRITNIYGDIKGCGNGLIYTKGRWSQIIKEVKEEKMGTQKLSRKGLKEIHSVACSTWKVNLENYSKRNTLEDYIELTNIEVNHIFNSCTKEQLPIVSKYLKQDDGSVDLETLCLRDNEFLTIRNCFEYTNKAFWLNDKFNWEIKKDSDDELCLIPTKKK